MSAVADTRLTPFKGLMPFEDSELDALLFFGREREREIVVANLMASRLTILYGPSGVGKTSLLRAGVARALREVPDTAVIVVSSWPGDPLHALRSEIKETVGLSVEDGTLADLLESAARVVGGDVYVILDQFEEYFLYHERGLGRDSFVAQVADAVQQPGLRANFLIGVREDALAKLDSFKAWIPGPFANSLRLDRLDRAAGEAAIVGPVNAYNSFVEPAERLEVEPGLIIEALAQVAAGRVDLGRSGRGTVGGAKGTDRIEAPYLQLVLERLWDVETAAGSHRLRLETLERLGGATRIVEDHLERAMAGLSPDEQDAAAAMYNHLVTPSGTKIAHGVSDLAGYAAVDEAEAGAVLRRLSAERIVRAGENGGAGRYEIFHDVLADAVLAWRARHEGDRRLQEQRHDSDRRHRRMLLLVAGALGALCIVAGLAVYALVQRSDARHQAVRAESQRVVALQQQRKAEAAKADALRERNAAKSSAAAANRAEVKAQAARREATKQAANATAQKANAEEQRRAADAARRQAQANAEAATTQAVRAKTQENRAKHNATVALRQRKIAHARQLAADAKALLADDPERSVRKSLAAAASFRSAGLDPAPAVEDTLREGLVNLRVEAVLREAGPVQAAAFSPDGSLIVVAGDRGARIFDRSHNFRSLRLEPATTLDTAAFSPDGLLVAAGGGRTDHAVHVWDARTGAILDTLPHDGAIRSVAFSPDGRLLATGSADGTARLWSVAGGLPLAVFPHPPGARTGVQQVSFSPDGTRLLTVGGDRFARVFDVATKTQVLKLEGTGFLNSARFSHDGKLIVTAGNDPLVRIWNARTGDLEYTLRHSGGVNDAVFSPNDALLATAGGLDTIGRVWRLSDRTVTAMFTRQLSGLESVAFTPDGQSVLSQSRDRNVYIWAADGGFEQAAFVGHQAPVNEASFSPDGRTVLTASDDGTARLWDARVNVAGPVPPAFATLVGNHGLAVNDVAFRPDGRQMLSAGADGTARLWGPGDRVIVLRHDAAVTAASFSRDGAVVITASKDGTARTWRTDDGTPLSTLRHGAPLETARLSPNGRLAVTAGDDGSALLWDVRRGEVLHRLLHQGVVRDAEFSRDGKKVVTASADDTAVIWRVADGSRLRTLSGHTAAVVTAAFTPDDRHVVTASADGSAMIWNAETGAREHELTGHTGAITAIAFNPSGSLVATASLDRDVRVWAVRTGQQVALLRIHSGFVSDVAFSADGRWLASAGPEATGIWETRKTGTWPSVPLYLVRVGARPTNAVAFSPRGWRILTGSRDGSVRSFDCKLCGRISQLAPIARARLAQIARSRP